jgi:hypothetical protein
MPFLTPTLQELIPLDWIVPEPGGMPKSKKWKVPLREGKNDATHP